MNIIELMDEDLRRVLRSGISKRWFVNIDSTNIEEKLKKNGYEIEVEITKFKDLLSVYSIINFKNIDYLIIKETTKNGKNKYILNNIKDGDESNILNLGYLFDHRIMFNDGESGNKYESYGKFLEIYKEKVFSKIIEESLKSFVVSSKINSNFHDTVMEYKGISFIFNFKINETNRKKYKNIIKIKETKVELEKFSDEEIVRCYNELYSILEKIRIDSHSEILNEYQFDDIKEMILYCKLNIKYYI